MEKHQRKISFVAGPIEIVPQDRSGSQGVVIARTANVAGGCVSRSAFPGGRAAGSKITSPCPKWKNIPVDRISSVSTCVGTADDIITFVSHFAEGRGSISHFKINKF